MKECIECLEWLPGGRADKRFCSDRCRAAFHNKKKRDSEGLARQDVRIILKNARILFEVYEFHKKVGGMVIRTESELIRKGFDFCRFAFRFMDDPYEDEFYGIGAYGFRVDKPTKKVIIIKIPDNAQRV